MLAAGGALLSSEEAGDAWTNDRLLTALTKGVPAADLAPRTAEVETNVARAVELLTGDSGEGSSCRSACNEAEATLGALCVGLIRPEAARSKAVCYGRMADLAGACVARCPQ